MTARNLLTSRELASRDSDGLHVRLLWDATDDTVAVTVVDTRRHQAFTIDVREGDRPLDVFRHPYAYAGDLVRVGGEGP